MSIRSYSVPDDEEEANERLDTSEGLEAEGRKGILVRGARRPP